MTIGAQLLNNKKMVYFNKKINMAKNSFRYFQNIASTISDFVSNIQNDEFRINKILTKVKNKLATFKGI